MEDWNDYQRMVLGDLKRLSRDLDRIEDKISSLHVEVAQLKIKSGMWGVIGGLFSVSLMIAIQYLIKK